MFKLNMIMHQNVIDTDTCTVMIVLIIGLNLNTLEKHLKSSSVYVPAYMCVHAYALVLSIDRLQCIAMRNTPKCIHVLPQGTHRK